MSAMQRVQCDSGHCVIDSSITIFILHCESELQLAKYYKLMHI